MTEIEAIKKCDTLINGFSINYSVSYAFSENNREPYPTFRVMEEFANTCKKALEEIQQYRAMEERLNGISVKQVVDGFVKQVENETQEEYKQGRILTNKEAEDWNEYRAIGTVEELKALKEKNEPKKIVINNVPKTSWTKATTKFTCPSCDRVIGFNGLNYCSVCGQKLDWE